MPYKKTYYKKKRTYKKKRGYGRGRKPKMFRPMHNTYDGTDYKKLYTLQDVKYRTIGGAYYIVGWG